MKYNDTEKTIKNEMEVDDMNIKSHLNTSLDLSGISVSEDLINRTLVAISNQTIIGTGNNKGNNNVTEKTNKKAIAWNRYARGFAGVAAAALIISISYGALTHLPVAKKEGSTNTAESQEQFSVTMESADRVSEDATTSSEATAAYDESVTDTAKAETTEEAATEEAVQYGLTADTSEAVTGTAGTADNTMVASEDSGTSNTDDTLESAGITTEEPKLSSSLKISEDAVLTFRDIFLPEPEKAEYITITDDTNRISVTLTEQADILNFYAIMDNHQFTVGVEPLTEKSYTVEVKSLQDGVQYFLTVGNNITVRYLEGDNTVESTYNEMDETLLKQDLNGLIMSFSK